MISLKNVDKYFNKGRENEVHVINGITAELPEKGMTAIFGKSGCGKTTLLNVIGGLDSYSGGSIQVDGRDIRRNTDEIRNRYIGYVFQNYNLNKQETVYENVADALRLCGMNDEQLIGERVSAALENVGMLMYKNRTPDTLSGGQQQRIAIARAIVKNPKIILADEPTGNLDETNTVMIMDLLRTVADDHLVILVTHEENLVKYYCDTVISLEDGKIKDIRDQNVAGGYVSRDKNDIYLGELEKNTGKAGGVEVEYYGEEKNIQLKIVNNGGHIYLQINTPGVKIIDESSEIRLREGVFETSVENKTRRNVDMSALPPMKEGGDESGFGKKFGRLFTFRSSLKSGWNQNFKGSKNGKKALMSVMALAAVVMVIMTAVFGTSIKKVSDIDSQYNNNVFYVYTPDAATAEKLAKAEADPDSGIDYTRITNSYSCGDVTIYFVSGCFESFDSDTMGRIEANFTLMSADVLDKADFVAGRSSTEKLGDNEIIITTAVADRMIENSPLGYVDSYQSLIGMISTSAWVNNTNAVITGIVKGNESAAYVSNYSLAMYEIKYNSGSALVSASDADMTVEKGEVILCMRNSSASGDVSSIKISGKDYKVKKVITFYENYPDWLKGNGYSSDLPEKIAETKSIPLGQAIVEYYSHIDEYLDAYGMFEYHYITFWLATEKDSLAAKCVFTGDASYYNAVKFYEKNGRYPGSDDLTSAEWADTEAMYDDYNELEDKYMSDYYRSDRAYSNPDNCVVMEDEEFACSVLNFGETDGLAIGNLTLNLWYISDDEGEMVKRFTVVHSTDVKKTEAYLTELFPDSEELPTGDSAVLTPSAMHEKYMSESRTSIVTSVVTMCVITGMICICMYFIMRSALMTRVKEIGIYRAIGTSKKNIIFRFMTETSVLTALTVLVALVLASLPMFYLCSLSPDFESFVYYPLWLAVILAVVMFAICLFCGTAPVFSLLKKTPAEIIAKYDI